MSKTKFKPEDMQVAADGLRFWYEAENFEQAQEHLAALITTHRQHAINEACKMYGVIARHCADTLRTKTIAIVDGTLPNEIIDAFKQGEASQREEVYNLARWVERQCNIAITTHNKRMENK